MMDIQFTFRRIAVMRTNKFYAETGVRLPVEQDAEGYWLVSVPDNFVAEWKEIIEVGR